VRTTLKRGIGRGAVLNGSGRSILPPSALTPMTRYRQPEPPRRGPARVVGKILFWFFASVVMVAVALVGGWYLFLHESIAATRPHSRDVKLGEKHLTSIPPPGHAAIALLLGYDHRANEAKSDPSRSDTVMLVRADPRTKTITMLSFPRDMVVNVVCPGHVTVRDRINSAYAKCGSTGTVETVKELTGLPINYLITVNFRGFKQVVNTLGGVWIDVDRIARQQQFVQAIKEQFRRNFSLTKVPRLINRITHNVEIGAGGRKEPNVGTLLSYALFLYHLPAGHFFQAKINGLSGYAELQTDASNIQAAVHDFVSPDVEAPKQATAAALNEKVREVAPKPENTTIATLNGNGVLGDAAKARYEIARQGYKTILPPTNATGDAPRSRYYPSYVYYDPAQPGARAAAAAVVKLFAPARAQAMPPEIKPLANGAMLCVVVGTTYHGTIASSPAEQVPEHKPAQVIYNKDASEPLLASVRAKAGFRLQVPTVIEQTSVPDPELPVRAYAIAPGYKAVRLVFRTGGREYWGVQETTWPEAPVLGDRSVHRILNGRSYDLYFHGPHLHMIVLHQFGATYWVVNTLLDSLSNETMLSIAKSLHPLDAGRE
jgi:LCP family protein required for cell wall assembly